MRNYMIWALYSIVFGILLYGIGLDFNQHVTAAMILGFFAGQFNEIITQLKVLNDGKKNG
jgi:hypothetical protein